MPIELDKNDVLSASSSGSRRFFVMLDSKPGLQMLSILLIAGALCLPCLFYGLPAGTNAPTHVKYQHHFSRQFWNGEIYPRWLVEENKGYGSPIFLAQYPLPYFVTALLRPITSFPTATREARELGLFAWLALAAAGLAAWFWLRKFTRPLAATLAAIVYISLPYILDDGVYRRVAIGELCTFIWMPLALSLCESMYKKHSLVFALSGVYALLVLSNVLSALLFTPVLTIYAVFCVKRTEPSLFRRALPVLFAQLLGAGIAGAYLVPLLAFRRFFDLHQMESILPGYQFGLYFLNIASSDLKSRVVLGIAGALLFTAATAAFLWRASLDVRVRIGMAITLVLGALALIPNLGLSIVRLSGFQLRPAPAYDFAATTLLGAFFTIALGLLAFCRTSDSGVGRRDLLLLCIAAVSFFLMLPFSAPIWKAIPGSSAIQFPFRLGGILCVAVAGLLSLAFDICLRDSGDPSRRPSRLVIALAAFAAIAGGVGVSKTDRAFHSPKITEFVVTQDIDPMYRAYVPLQQLPAFAKTLGTTPDSFQVEPTPGDGTLRTAMVYGDCAVNVRPEGPRELLVSSDCKGEARLRIGQLFSPLWRIVPVQTGSRNSAVGASADGLIELALLPGKQEMRLIFDMGFPERLGIISSVFSLLIALVGFVSFRNRIGPGVPTISDESPATP